MNKLFKTILLCLPLGLFSVNLTLAQTQKEKDAAYLKVVTQRADKIVEKLDVNNEKTSTRVRDIIANQYVNLNAIHENRDAKIKAVKELNKDNKEKAQTEINALEDEASAKLAKLHKKYLAQLSKYLDAGQIEKVKDGMTYGVLPITYNGYQQMLPDLTEKQKKQILDYLTEAREHAMDAGSSEKKHAWFGKYKGRINNYLSAEGIDMKQASKAWEERIKASKASKANN